MQGYLEAETIDSIINKFLEQSPITKENARQWMLFSRTIQTSLDLVNSKVEEATTHMPARLLYTAEHPKYPHIQVQLTGVNGNAYAIINEVKLALQRNGIGPEEISRFNYEATSGSYEQLLQTCLAWVKVN